MFGNINTIIPKTMPTVSGCACKMIVKRMEKTGGKRRGKRLFNSPALQARIASISQLMGSCHSPSELPAKDQKLRRQEECPAVGRCLPLLFVPQPFSTRYTLVILPADF